MLAFLISLAPAAYAATVSDDVLACFNHASEQHNIPVELLLSIAEVESGLRPLALNRGGSALLPRNREQADQVVEEWGKQRTTFDVGIMQVNRWWFEKYAEPYGKGLDPCFNIDFGARILTMAIRDYGFTWQAVGRYHSPTTWRQESYARKIFTRLSKLLEKRRTKPLEKIIASTTHEIALNQRPDQAQSIQPASSEP